MGSRALLSSVVWIVFVALSLLRPAGAHGQYMYLDANGDGANTPEDHLNPLGSSTSLAIYVSTNRNADATTAICNGSSEEMTLNSYELILKAIGGAVAFSNYTSALPAMDTQISFESSSTDLYVAYVGSSTLAPGTFHLGDFSVTVLSGEPTIVLATSTTLDSHAMTSFGSRCPGADQDNTLKLGTEWFNTGSCGPPEGSGAAPSVATPTALLLDPNVAVAITSEFGDFDQSDSVLVSVSGLPEGLRAVQGWQHDRRRQVRVYGLLPAHSTDTTTYLLTWRASDGENLTSSESQIRSLPLGVIPSDLSDRVDRVVKKGYSHGMPVLEIRALGRAALPYLYRMLRDEDQKRHWFKVVKAIGAIGDTASFDSLHAFIWSRFSGGIDVPTFMAISMAQSMMSSMAVSSRRVMEYLVGTAQLTAWMRTPWKVIGQPARLTPVTMAKETQIALSRIDAEGADEYFDNLVPPSDPIERSFYDGLLRVHRSVRLSGMLDLWRREDERRLGGTR